MRSAARLFLCWLQAVEELANGKYIFFLQLIQGWTALADQDSDQHIRQGALVGRSARLQAHLHEGIEELLRKALVAADGFLNQVQELRQGQRITRRLRWLRRAGGGEFRHNVPFVRFPREVLYPKKPNPGGQSGKAWKGLKKDRKHNK